MPVIVDCNRHNAMLFSVQGSAFDSVPGLWAVLVGAAIILSARLISKLIRAIRPPYGALSTDRAAIVELSEDLQHRILDERRGSVGTPKVLAWDAHAYRLARLRLRTRDKSAEVQAALLDLDEARAGLRAAWQLSKTDPGAFPGDLETALQAHASAINQFAEASAILVRISWQRRRPRGTVADA
jgi:hypothetical protein